MFPNRISMQRALNTFTSFKERILSGKKEKIRKKDKKMKICDEQNIIWKESQRNKDTKAKKDQQGQSSTTNKIISYE